VSLAHACRVAIALFVLASPVCLSCACDLVSILDILLALIVCKLALYVFLARVIS